MGGADVAAIEREGLAPARRLPSQSALSELALPRLFREVEVDVIEALPGWVSVTGGTMVTPG